MISDIFWNKLDLPSPQIHIYKVCDDKPKNIVQRLLKLCNSVNEILKGNGSLNMEAAALSRLIYRVKGRLRRDKGLQAMVKVNRCLIQYLNLNILSELSVISKPLSDDLGPSRQMLEWFLVRLQGVAQLFHRIYKTCLEAAEQLSLRIKLGHIWSIALIAFANISRIWTISQYMVKSVCSWYVDLYSFLDKLKPASEQWLPEDYILPPDLFKFLGEPSYLVKTQAGNTDSAVFSQLTKNEGEMQTSVKNNMNDTFNCVFGLSEDIGEQISRDQINNNNKKVVPVKRKSLVIDELVDTDMITKKKKKKQTFKLDKSNKKEMMNIQVDEKNKFTNQNEVFKASKKNTKKSAIKQNNNIKSRNNINQIDNIRCYSDLKNFIKVEQKRRLGNSKEKKNLTRNMDNLQFQMFSNFIQKYLKKMKRADGTEKLEHIVNKLHKNMYVYLSS